MTPLDNRYEKLPSHHRLAWPTLLVMKEVDRPVHNSEVVQLVAEALSLSPELVEQPLGQGRGRRTRLEYKLSWARTLLKGLGAIELVHPAVWVITERGKLLQESDVTQATDEMLSQLTRRRNG